jgi:hypothetical protein
MRSPLVALPPEILLDISNHVAEQKALPGSVSLDEPVVSDNGDQQSTRVVEHPVAALRMCVVSSYSGCHRL